MGDSDLEALLLGSENFRDDRYFNEVNFGQPEIICRICHEEAESNEDLFRPCRCRGSIQWVHYDCLNHWRTFTQNPEAKNRCLECHYRYQIIDRPISQPSICSQMVKFLSRNPIYFYVLNQIFILFLTVAIYFIDHNDIINRFFQPWVGEPPQKPIHGFWSLTKQGNYIFASGLVVVGWLLVFLLNLIFQIKKRRLYLKMFIQTSCHLCTLLLLLATFGLATFINPIIGTMILTLILHVFLNSHYHFMDQINDHQRQEILPYSEEIDTDLRTEDSDDSEYLDEFI